ncbi:MAG: outer membrane lipoprotein-sorting protein, partial [Fimbriimonadales bacterium]
VLSSLSLDLTAQRSLTAEQILDRMTQASASREALAKIRTVRMRATITYPSQNLQGTMEMNFKTPSRLLLKVNIQGIGEILQGYDGKVGWEKNPLTGLREIKGAELDQLRLTSNPASSYNWRQQLRSPRLAGTAKVDNRDAYVIEAKSVTGGDTKWYIDTKNFYLLRTDMTIATQQGTIPTTSYFSGYRRVDGILYPFTLRQVALGMESRIQFTEVKHNVPLNDSIFRKPKQ